MQQRLGRPHPPTKIVMPSEPWGSGHLVPAVWLGSNAVRDALNAACAAPSMPRPTRPSRSRLVDALIQLPASVGHNKVLEAVPASWGTLVGTGLLNNDC